MNEVSRYAQISMPWSDLLRLPTGGSGGGGSGDGGGPGGGGSSGGGGGGAVDGSPNSSQPSGGPAPLRVSDEDLRKLFDLHSAEPVDGTVALRERLPDYVVDALSGPGAAGNGELPDDPTLPEVVAVIKGN